MEYGLEGIVWHSSDIFFHMSFTHAFVLWSLKGLIEWQTPLTSDKFQITMSYLCAEHITQYGHLCKTNTHRDNSPNFIMFSLCRAKLFWCPHRGLFNLSRADLGKENSVCWDWRKHRNSFFTLNNLSRWVFQSINANFIRIYEIILHDKKPQIIGLNSENSFIFFEEGLIHRDSSFSSDLTSGNFFSS